MSDDALPVNVLEPAIMAVQGLTGAASVPGAMLAVTGDEQRRRTVFGHGVEQVAP
ncbi:hypothetical protein RCH14_004320 [Massilia sp. MP_M2]|uniref:hypothetical protein n=1 Tax=Massilia sp. MP_M2 TaxID=3071713 RepID=UPI00319E4EC0